MGTPASIKFARKRYIQLYSHYDGYPEGVALKLYAALSAFDFDPQYMHTLGNACLLNRLIAANMDTLSIEHGQDSLGCEWEYYIIEDTGTISWGQRGGNHRVQPIADFVNEQIARWASNLKCYVIEHEATHVKTDFDVIRNFSPCIQHTEKRHIPLFLTVDKAQLVCTALLEEADRWEADRPNNRNIASNREQAESLTTLSRSAMDSKTLQIIRSVSEWAEARAEA